MNIQEILAAIDREISQLRQARALLADGGKEQTTGKKRGRPKGSGKKAAKKQGSALVRPTSRAGRSSNRNASPPPAGETSPKKHSSASKLPSKGRPEATEPAKKSPAKRVATKAVRKGRGSSNNAAADRPVPTPAVAEVETAAAKS